MSAPRPATPAAARAVRTLAAPFCLCLCLVSCQTMAGSPTSGDGVFAVPGTDAMHHRLRFLDGQVSPNDSCMVRLGNRLNERVPPLYVNGEPVGFC